MRKTTTQSHEYDIMSRSWEEAESQLTPKQKQWCKIYISLDIPTAAKVAGILNITKQASNQMMKRILRVLGSAYQEHLNRKANDEILLRVAVDKHEKISRQTEYLEKRRGSNHWTYWQAEKPPNERLGIREGELYSGYYGRQIDAEEYDKLKHLPKYKRTTHKASPLSTWWKKKTHAYASTKKIKYSEAFRELQKIYFQKWPKNTAPDGRWCHFCRVLLPLGETIPESKMGKVTIRRKYCSDSCKTLSKRAPK